jgi:DNA-binding transcriptional regulator LsrR (DeoR family)
VDASARLQERYGLSHALVIETDDTDPASIWRQLGESGFGHARLSGQMTDSNVPLVPTSSI